MRMYIELEYNGGRDNLYHVFYEREHKNSDKPHYPVFTTGTLENAVNFIRFMEGQKLEERELAYVQLSIARCDIYMGNEERFNRDKGGEE